MAIILGFAFFLLIVFSFLLLPTVLVLFSPRSPWYLQLLWIAATLAPAVIQYGWPGAIGPTVGIAGSISWLVCLAFLYFTHPPVRQRKPWKIGVLATGAVLFTVLLGASIAQTLRLSYQCKQSHVVYWPMDVMSPKWVKLHLPPGCGVDDDPPDRQKIVSKDGRPVVPDHTMTFNLRWPEMTEPTAEEIDSKYKLSGRPLLYIEVMPGAIERYPQRVANSLQSWAQITIASQVKECLPSTSPSCYETALLVDSTDVYGLKQVRVKSDHILVMKYKSQAEDVFYSPELGSQLKTLITCNGEGAVPNPLCQQRFLLDSLNALVVLHYRRRYLKDWQRMEAATQTFLTSLMDGGVPPSPPTPPNPPPPPTATPQ